MDRGVDPPGASGQVEVLVILGVGNAVSAADIELGQYHAMLGVNSRHEPDQPNALPA